MMPGSIYPDTPKMTKEDEDCLDGICCIICAPITCVSTAINLIGTGLFGKRTNYVVIDNDNPGVDVTPCLTNNNPQPK